MLRLFLKGIAYAIGISITPFLFVLALIARFSHKRIDVGLGPEPLINNIYHKKSLEIHGFSAETFVTHTYFITQEFDKIFDCSSAIIGGSINALHSFIYALFTYKSIFIYFNGGPLHYLPFLKHVEPLFFKLAGIRILVMPYGSDVQYMQCSKNLYFKHCLSLDYPSSLKQNSRVLSDIQRWTRWGDWVVSGCEWVDYMYFWNSLMLAHFSIDTIRWSPAEHFEKSPVFRILHAPNHKNIKGTTALQKAVDKLADAGFSLELVILQGVPNNKIQNVMSSVDLVADQFVIGWYAMFAIEAMSMEKPVLCYLRNDLIELYQKTGLLEKNELPIIQCDILEIEDKIRWAMLHRNELRLLGKKGRRFVQKHHSIESVGMKFAIYLRAIGIVPSERTSTISI